jgi:hypothetical protein
MHQRNLSVTGNIIFKSFLRRLAHFLIKWNVFNLGCDGVLQVFTVAFYHDKVPDLNAYLALWPLLASTSLRGGGGNKRRYSKRRVQI